MDFQEAESKYFELKGRFNSGTLTAEQFRTEVAGLQVQDSEGRYWTVDARTGGWLLYDGTTWVPAQPPGSVAMPVPPPASTVSPERGGRSSLLLVGALAVAAVLCVVALGGAGFILSRFGGITGGEEGGPSVVSQQEAERIADELVAKSFPDLIGAEKTMGSFQNPAGTKFWTVTYRRDVQVELQGTRYEIPNLVIVSVDKDTGEALVSVSG